MLVELVDTAVGALLFPILAGLYLIDHGPQLNLILYLYCSNYMSSPPFQRGVTLLKQLTVVHYVYIVWYD